MDTTILDPAMGKNQGQQGQQAQNVNKAKSHGAAAGITGVVIGASGAIIIGKLIDDLLSRDHSMMEENIELTANEGQEAVEGAEVTYETPDWAVGDLMIAEGVDDSMTFSQAFAAARAEVGPGGAFEWKGTVYGTYTANEWNSMTPAEKSEFNSHFNWNNVDTSSNVGVTSSNPIGVNDVEVISVDDNAPLRTETASHIEIVDADTQPEIEVLGVVHDHETGANIGGISVDGQEVYLVDVDGDLEFDIVASDLNNNGQLDEDEAYDIHGQGLTVDHLGGFSDPNDAIQASDDYIASTDDFAMPV